MDDTGLYFFGYLRLRDGITLPPLASTVAAMANPQARCRRPHPLHRSTLLREVETRIAELMEANRDLDDLALQFDGTEAGQQFISAWKQAGIIVDAGHGPGYGIPTPVTPPTP